MPISPAKILEQLMPLHPDTFQDDLVGIFVSIADGVASHSGLIISYKGVINLCHFDSKRVIFKETPVSAMIDEVFVKKLDIIDKRIIPSFLSHCKRIDEEASPIYGYFYNGEYYRDGVYYTENRLPQLMSCVGFCLNVITGFIEEEKYLEFEDWVLPTSLKAEKWFSQFVEDFIAVHGDSNIEDLKKSFRRIKPSELLSSGYYTKLPIRKIDVDPINTTLVEKFQNLGSSSKAS